MRVPHDVASPPYPGYGYDPYGSYKDPVYEGGLALQ